VNLMAGLIVTLLVTSILTSCVFVHDEGAEEFCNAIFFKKGYVSRGLLAWASCWPVIVVTFVAAVGCWAATGMWRQYVKAIR
jgi:hypothetical protein